MMTAAVGSLASGTGVTEPAPDRLRSRLGEMTEKLASLEKTVATETLRKRAVEEQRLQSIATAVSTLEEDLTEEIKQRVESCHELESLGRALVEETASKLDERLQKMADNQAEALEAVVARCERLENSLKDSDNGSATQAFSELESHLASVKTSTRQLREELEALLLPQVDDSLRRSIRRLRDMRRNLTRTLEDDIAEFDASLTTLRQQCAHAQSEAEESNATYKLYIPQEMAAFREAIRQEAGVREETDDAMVQALNEYNTTLQKGFSVMVGAGGEIKYDYSFSGCTFVEFTRVACVSGGPSQARIVRNGETVTREVYENGRNQCWRTPL